MKPTKEYNGRSRIRMFNVDCMDFMEDCDKYDLAIVDPPYGILNKMGGNTSLNNKKWDGKKWDELPKKEYFNTLFNISKNTVVFGANYFTEHLESNKKWIVWDKMLYQDQSHVELIWTSFEGADRMFKFSKSNLQGFRNPNRFHPTEKPINIYKYILKNHAKEGDTILDTHGGSMSIAIACWDLGFDLDIIELDEDYFNDAVKRFEQHISQTQLF